MNRQSKDRRMIHCVYVVYNYGRHTISDSKTTLSTVHTSQRTTFILRTFSWQERRYSVSWTELVFKWRLSIMSQRGETGH